MDSPTAEQHLGEHLARTEKNHTLKSLINQINDYIDQIRRGNVSPRVVAQFEARRDALIEQNKANRESILRLQHPDEIKTVFGRALYKADTGVNYFNDDGSVKDEDRVSAYVGPNARGEEVTGFCCVDGMGGYGKSARAADIFSEQALIGFHKGATFQEVQNAAHQAMKAEGLEKDGVVYASVRIHENSMDISHAGDTKVIVIRNGTVVFETEDHSSDGRKVNNFVNGDRAGFAFVDKFDLQPGDRVVMASDGLWDRITPKRVAEMASGKSINEAYQDIQSRQLELMQKKESEIDREGYGNYREGDNRSLILYEHLVSAEQGQSAAEAEAILADTEISLPSFLFADLPAWVKFEANTELKQLLESISDAGVVFGSSRDPIPSQVIIDEIKTYLSVIEQHPNVNIGRLTNGGELQIRRKLSGLLGMISPQDATNRVELYTWIARNKKGSTQSLMRQLQKIMGSAEEISSEKRAQILEILQ